MNASSQAGFTLTELLVGLNLAFLVLTFSFGLFLSSSKLFNSWEAKRSLRSQVNSIAHRLSRDIAGESGFELVGDSVLILSQSHSPAITIGSHNGSLVRNGHQITFHEHPGIRLRFAVQNNVPSLIDRITFNLSARSKGQVHTVSMTLPIKKTAREVFYAGTLQ